MKNKLFEVGQEVYILNRSNGYNSPHVIEPAVVEKVGRKYIRVKRKWTVLEFELGHTENGVVKLPRKFDVYTHYMHLFLTKEDAENERTRHLMANNLKKCIDSFGTPLLHRMSLEDLQKIGEIVYKYVQ